jgi:dynein heavy chain
VFSQLECVSLGAGQEQAAAKAFTACVASGSWLLLQNCHLAVKYMSTLAEALTRTECHADFRLLLTSEPVTDFPPAMLHLATKVSVLIAW